MKRALALTGARKIATVGDAEVLAIDAGPEPGREFDPVGLLEMMAKRGQIFLDAGLIDDKGMNDIAQLMSAIQKARKARWRWTPAAQDFAQSMFFWLGWIARSNLFQGEQRQQETGSIENVIALIRDRTRAATSGKTAMKEQRQQYIEGIDRQLGTRDKRKETKDRRITAIRNHIIGIPAADRPECVRKVPSKRTIRQYVK